MEVEGQLYELIYAILYKALEHPWIWVSAGVPITNPLQILRDNYVFGESKVIWGLFHCTGGWLSQCLCCSRVNWNVLRYSFEVWLLRGKLRKRSNAVALKCRVLFSAMIFPKECVKAGRRDGNTGNTNKVLKFSVMLWHLIDYLGACGMHALCWPLIISTSWHSHLYIISSPEIWSGSVICF